VNIVALCQSCGQQGVTPFGGHAKPAWCKCTGKKLGGPYVAPPGYIVRFAYESTDDAAFREACRLAGNAEREARDNLSQRFVRSGKGWRELPRSSPKRRALEAAYRKASRALEALRARCPHTGRSLFSKAQCDICYAHVECDVEHHRHLVREAGEEFARRVAV
jgi:hypothetical protein